MGVISCHGGNTSDALGLRGLGASVVIDSPLELTLTQMIFSKSPLRCVAEIRTQDDQGQPLACLPGFAIYLPVAERSECLTCF